jgi:hypothetical protein
MGMSVDTKRVDRGKRRKAKRQAQQWKHRWTKQAAQLTGNKPLTVLQVLSIVIPPYQERNYDKVAPARMAYHVDHLAIERATMNGDECTHKRCDNNHTQGE